MLRDAERAERMLRAQAEHEVGEVVAGCCSAAVLTGLRELPGVAVEAVERIDVLHFDVDVLELVARLRATGGPSATSS